MSGGAKYEVVWPRGRRAISVKPVAKRHRSLDGKKVAFLWDYLFRGDEIFPMIEAELKSQFSGVSFVGYHVFGSTHGGEERQILADLPRKLRDLGVDAVVSGMGC